MWASLEAPCRSSPDDKSQRLVLNPPLTALKNKNNEGLGPLGTICKIVFTDRRQGLCGSHHRGSDGTALAPHFTLPIRCFFRCLRSNSLNRWGNSGEGTFFTYIKLCKWSPTHKNTICRRFSNMGWVNSCPNRDCCSNQPPAEICCFCRHLQSWSHIIMWLFMSLVSHCKLKHVHGVPSYFIVCETS